MEFSRFCLCAWRSTSEFLPLLFLLQLHSSVSHPSLFFCLGASAPPYNHAELAALIWRGIYSANCQGAVQGLGQRPVYSFTGHRRNKSACGEGESFFSFFFAGRGVPRHRTRGPHFQPGAIIWSGASFVFCMALWAIKCQCLLIYCLGGSGNRMAPL